MSDAIHNSEVYAGRDRTDASSDKAVDRQVDLSLALYSKGFGKYALAIALTIIVAGFTGYRILIWTSDNIVTRQAERTALSWAQEFGTRLTRIEEIVAGGAISPSEASFITHASGLGDVFRLKLFDRDGRLVMVADDHGFSVAENNRLADHNKKAARVVAEGEPFTQLADGRKKPNRPDLYVESYVPVTRNGNIVAIVEVYIDQTEAAKIVRTDFAIFGMKFAGLTTLALLVPGLMLMRTSRQLAQQNAALQAERERTQIAEKRLLQAQRMEAIGQLTGGVAHDFNNLLAVIIGNAEVLEDELGQNDRPLSAIMRSATRGAELTRRLLAYSRQQSLRPETFDAGALVGDMANTLARTLGETVVIETSAAPDLWPVRADPRQVEYALSNLASNARDAMPEGGKLKIACENRRLDADFAAENPGAPTGEFVAVTMRDEGCGMTAEVRARAFEPFFTTKDVGKGSGLGLSMVYGFAKQSSGYVQITSAVGQGTSVKLFLPRSTTTAAASRSVPEEGIPRGDA